MGSSSAASSSAGSTASISSSGDGMIDSVSLPLWARCSASARSCCSSGLTGAVSPTMRRPPRTAADGGGSEGVRWGVKEGGRRAAAGSESGVRMLAGGSDGGALDRFRDDAGTDGGGGTDTPPTGPPCEPPVSASTLRTSEGTSTGRTNRPLPSSAMACSGLATAPPGRAMNSTSMSSASGSSRIRATTSSAPSPSASTRMMRGCCTATRATSIDSGTSTTT